MKPPKTYREVLSSERLHDKKGFHAVRLYDKNGKPSKGFTGFWYNPTLDRYKKIWRKEIYIWLEPIPERSKTAEEIVKENFKGLNDLIEDNDLRKFYLNLIVTCMEEYVITEITEEKFISSSDYNYFSVIHEEIQPWIFVFIVIAGAIICYITTH